jgi:hypothetical protein
MIGWYLFLVPPRCRQHRGRDPERNGDRLCLPRICILTHVFQFTDPLVRISALWDLQ